MNADGHSGRPAGNGGVDDIDEGIWRIRKEGGDFIEMEGAPDAFGSPLAADSTWLYSSGGNGVYRVPHQGGTAELVGPVDTAWRVFDLDVSGGRAAVIENKSTDAGRAVVLAGGGRIVLDEWSDWLGWIDASGDRVALVSGGDSFRVSTAPLGGGTVRRLGSIAGPLAGVFYDGECVTFTRGGEDVSDPGIFTVADQP